MLLKSLIQNVEVIGSNVPQSTQITAVTDDNRKITAG